MQRAIDGPAGAACGEAPPYGLRLAAPSVTVEMARGTSSGGAISANVPFAPLASDERATSPERRRQDDVG